MIRIALLALGTFCFAAACGSDADDIGVGAQCAMDDDCNQDDGAQTCLLFKGGYCGLAGCANDGDCPEASACITHTDTINYCFRVCSDKPQCNENRDLENESNCSSSVDFVSGAMGRKACVPPS